MKFSKDDKEYTWATSENIVYASVLIGESWVVNPTIEMLLSNGFVVVTSPIAESSPIIETINKPSYDELVQQYIHEHGYPTYDKELAVINNFLHDSDKYREEWEAYQAIRQEAKIWAESNQIID